jgi:hypothetical protein
MKKNILGNSGNAMEAFWKEFSIIFPMCFFVILNVLTQKLYAQKDYYRGI